MSVRRRIVYVSGTRADFGLLKTTLQRIHESASLELSLVVTGMHLDPAYGHTIDDIRHAGLPIGATVNIAQGIPTGELMSKNLGRMVIGFTDAFLELKPEIVLVLGDRGEMLAAAIAAVHLNIPIAHIHGGERSGTVDELIRHSISKLSYLHLVATAQSRGRLIRMGENPDQVIEVGAPGLDGLEFLAGSSKEDVFRRYGFAPDRRLALVVYHPVHQETGANISAHLIIDAVFRAGFQMLALKPNSDAGSADILSALVQAESHADIRLVTHLERSEYVSLLRWADVLVGNSSSGIIEAATFGTPVVNIGNRQNLRERNANIIDVPIDGEAIYGALQTVVRKGRFEPHNVYGDGRSAERIVTELEKLDLNSPVLMSKTNEY